MAHPSRTYPRYVVRTLALGTTLVLAISATTMAGLESGELPAMDFSHTSVVDDAAAATTRTLPRLESVADVYAWLATKYFAEREAWRNVGVDPGMSRPISVDTTYTVQAADPGYRYGWHAAMGPVIVTVTAGTLTLVNDSCRTFDVPAGHSYIESAGEVLNAFVLPEKNEGVPATAWLMTTLSPLRAVEAPVEVEVPCAR
jgi:hypothetical protein